MHCMELLTSALWNSFAMDGDFEKFWTTVVNFYMYMDAKNGFGQLCISVDAG